MKKAMKLKSRVMEWGCHYDEKKGMIQPTFPPPTVFPVVKKFVEALRFEVDQLTEPMEFNDEDDEDKSQTEEECIEPKLPSPPLPPPPRS